LALVLLPISTGFEHDANGAGEIDTESNVGIGLEGFREYNYKDESGHTIIIGEVENTKNFPVTGIKIWAGFYDDVNLQPLESKTGTTLLQVIPPNSKSVYVIKSPSPNAAITNVSVNLLGFNSAGAKLQGLEIISGDLQIGDRVTFSGSITNTGDNDSENTKVHLVFYDAFEPPRLIRVASIENLTTITSESTVDFEFDELLPSQAVGFQVFAESTNLQSNTLDIEITPPELITKLISINDISIKDNQGNSLSDVRVNEPINIQSNIWIQIVSEQESYDQPYVYYTQVKQSGEKAFVEYIGTFEGKFEDPESQNPTVQWIPEKKGLFFIETFVWDPNAVPLASKGPIILVLVN
jgi:hypothetical protein